jgi:tetratricopeptide (TPR) repeat protein
LGGESTEAATALRRETDPGVVMGTVAYMSPEQAKGAKVDHRSDIFSFGTMLYEMLAGNAPFRGASGTETLSAILRDPAPPLPPLGHDVTPEVSADLERILDKSLAKDPGERYQGMKDLLVDLRAARRALESGSVIRHGLSGAAPAVAEEPRRPLGLIAGAAAAVLLLAGILYLVLRPSSERPAATDTAGSKPSIAVLYFDNVTKDPELDWLRTGLTDMLVTDLSQSPSIEVLGTDRLYQILREMNRLDERITSLDVVQEVAERAGVDTVILGSFMKSGEEIRINIRVQEAQSGKILTTEKVEGVGESSVFPLVDDLTERIKSKFDVPRMAQAELDRGLRDVTTPSLEAYRYYNEGVNLHYRFREEEATVLFEKAVELDPQFATALARLAVTHSNLGNDKESLEYSRLAVENAERLPPRERYYIEGNYYSQKEETAAQSNESYKRAVEHFPDHGPARNNLALNYEYLERWDECIQETEHLKRDQHAFPSGYSILAACYSMQGEFEKGHEALQAYIRMSPDTAAGYANLGFHLTRWGKLGEALEAFEKARSLQPTLGWGTSGRWPVFVLQEDWARAQATADELSTFGGRFWKYLGFISSATNRLYRGEATEALRQVQRAVGAYDDPGPTRAAAHSYWARILLAQGRAGAALEQARLAQTEGQGNVPEWEGYAYEALALQQMGRAKEAREAATQLSERTASLPSEKEKRRHHHLMGELALADGDTARAIDELTTAQSMLSPRGFNVVGIPPPHVPIWYSLASAYLAAGDDVQAAEWFERIADSGGEHINWPILYIRSFYLLGKIHESQGDTAAARQYYRRFVDFWKDGDLDRERVKEALGKIS